MKDPKKRIKKLEKKIKKLAKGPSSHIHQIEHGTVDFLKKPTVWEEDGARRCGSNRVRIRFDKKFRSKPHVIMGIYSIDISNTANTRLRIFPNEKSIKKSGFKYTFCSCANTEIHSAKAFWVAFEK